MLRPIWLAIVSIAISFVLPTQLHATEINDNTYNIYQGDLNGDGYSDFYFSAKPIFLILHGDISIPIPLFTPGVTSFVIYRSGAGYSDPQAYSFDYGTLMQKISQNVLRLAVANTDYYSLNNGVMGQSYVLLRGIDTSAPSLLINSFSTQTLPLIAQTYPPYGPLSDKSIPISISDINADGRKDILIAGYVYLADASGIPNLTPLSLNQSGTITTTITYDGLGRVQKVEATDGTASNYQYDKQDNRTSSSNVKGLQ